MEERQGKKTLVVGLGKTGLSCARHLVRRGVSVAVTDSRPEPPELATLREEMPDLALFLGGFQAEAFAVAEQIVVSPGVSMAEPLIKEAIARGVRVIGDIELFVEAARAPVIAVTGSNGKSTVVTLLGNMIKLANWRAGVGGNLGLPALELLDDKNRLYVLELSSFQLEATRSLKPLAAAVLNVSPDHMDRYAGIEDYAGVKESIYRDTAVAIINRDDPRVQAMSGNAPREIGFTLREPNGNDYGIRADQDALWICRGTQRLLPASEFKIPGTHNLANALAALALAEAAELPMPARLEALREFRGLAHRTQLVAVKKGVTWYNDSKGTNVGATIAALDGLHSTNDSGLAVLIAGGDCKGADFSELAPVVARTTRTVVLIGRDAPLIQRALEGNVELVSARDMDEAVSMAADKASEGDHVLLSPGCASFDMFANFEARGDAFAAAVSRLPE